MLARFVLITFHPILIFTHRGRAVSTSSGAAVRAVIRRYLTLSTPSLILPPHPPPYPPLLHPPPMSSILRSSSAGRRFIDVSPLTFALVVGRGGCSTASRRPLNLGAEASTPTRSHNHALRSCLTPAPKPQNPKTPKPQWDSMAIN